MKQILFKREMKAMGYKKFPKFGIGIIEEENSLVAIHPVRRSYLVIIVKMLTEHKFNGDKKLALLNCNHKIETIRMIAELIMKDEIDYQGTKIDSILYTSRDGSVRI